MATATGYEHNGRTTYCWRIPASFDAKDPVWTADVLASEARGCPLAMRLDLEASEVFAGAFVAVNWTVTVDRTRMSNSSSNAVRHTTLARVVDVASGRPVDIVHSNIHSCEFGSNCNPFRHGERFVDNTPNKVANVSLVANDANDVTTTVPAVVVFTSQHELRFPSPGIFSVLAHIILPGANSSSERFDYAVYQQLTVKEAPTAAPSLATPSTNALSTGGMVAIIIGAVALVVLGLFFVKRRRSSTRGSGAPATVPMHASVSIIPPREKTTFNDGYAELSTIPMLGRPRLGAAPHARTGGGRSDYLSGRDTAAPTVTTTAASHRPGDMDIRDFDPTIHRSGPTADSAARAAAGPHDMADSTFTIDFSYPDTTISEDLIVQRRTRQHSSGGDSGGTDLDTNDSYFVTDGLSTTSSRIFLSDTELSALMEADPYASRFSDRDSESLSERFSQGSDANPDLRNEEL